MVAGVESITGISEVSSVNASANTTVPSATGVSRVKEDAEVSTKSTPGRCFNPETNTASEPVPMSYVNSVRLKRVWDAVASNACFAIEPEAVTAVPGAHIDALILISLCQNV
jgi:hypothetical protein